MKQMNTNLVEKYNKQSEKINKIKQRLIFYIKKVEPNSDLLDEEDLINLDIVKNVEEVNRVISRGGSFSSNGDDPENSSMTARQGQAKTGMQAVE